jgi:hypothetical protein
METTKFNDLVSRVIGYVGYFLLTAFMTIFSILAVLALALVFIEKDIFNLVGVLGCALVVWVMWSIRKVLMS